MNDTYILSAFKNLLLIIDHEFHIRVGIIDRENQQLTGNLNTDAKIFFQTRWGGGGKMRAQH